MSEEILMRNIREAANTLGQKRLEFQELPGRIQQVETEMRNSADAESIRNFQTRLRELEREREVQEIALKATAVEHERAYLQLYKEQPASRLSEAEQAKEAHKAAQEAFKAAERALEGATQRAAKADHDVEESRRQIQQREIASELRLWAT